MARLLPVAPKFNKKWAKKAGKDKFVKVHKEAYMDLDLKAEYDKIVPPQKQTSEPVG